MDKTLTMPLTYRNITLRLTQESDLLDEKQWNTVETEWCEWDAPWEELEPYDIEVERKRLRCVLSNPPEVYGRVQLDTVEGRHIGWMSSYNIDGDTSLKAIGIDIPPLDARGKGYGRNAFILWAAYHFSNSGMEEIYTQTWSGNYSMIKLAESVGFEEIGRLKRIRRYRGERYDAITFSISITEFFKLYGDVGI